MTLNGRLKGIVVRCQELTKMMEKTTLKKVKRVLDFIKENPGVHVRGIAKSLNYRPGTIDWILNHYLFYFIEVDSPLEKPELKGIADIFGLKIKTIKLKPGKENTTMEDVLRYVDVRKRMKLTNKSSIS